MSNQQPDGTSEPTTPMPPAPPSFKPGSAPLPQPPNPDYPPTSEFPAAPTEQYGTQSYEPPPGYAPTQSYEPPPGYGPPQAYEPPPGYGPPAYGPPPGYAQPGYQQPPPPPRKSKTPMVLLVLAVTLLLCGGVATAGVLFVRNVTDRAKEALPELPTAAPQIPDLPTEVPSLPGNVPDVTGRKITVTYEVKGTGQASQILYVEKLGDTPKRLQNVDLPWKFTTEMDTPALVSVVAMRVGTTEGTIECRALVDGAEVKQRTSSPGNVATASCTHFAIE